MPLLSRMALDSKIRWMIQDIPKDQRILEVGCGKGHLGRYLKDHGWHHYTGLDLGPPADILGSILDWRKLEIEPASFDAVIAFEVIEHVDCLSALFDILRPGGLLLLTTPLPHMDWFCKLLEHLGLSQKRTSPHTNLVYIKDLPLFEILEIRNRWLTSQWARLRKPH